MDNKRIEEQIASGIAKRIAKYIAMGIAGIIALAIFIFIGGWFVQWLWNWLLPPLFGFPQVTFWQALGLLTLCRILFGGHGFGHSGGGRRYSREDKEQFKRAVKNRWGRDRSPVEEPPPAEA